MRHYGQALVGFKPNKCLRSAFDLVEDPRRAQSRRHPLTAMLTLIALGLLMGERDMLNIWRKVACLDQRQRGAIGLRVRHKESGLIKMPGYDALNDLFHLLDPAAYARALLADSQVRLENALITADPLHNKQATVRVIAEKGGDYLIGTKDNIPQAP